MFLLTGLIKIFYYQGMKDKLQSKLKTEGRSLRWFHITYLLNEKGITYNAMALQLNGYALICDDVKKAINQYLAD